MRRFENDRTTRIVHRGEESSCRWVLGSRRPPWPPTALVMISITMRGTYLKTIRPVSTGTAGRPQQLLIAFIVMDWFPRRVIWQMEAATLYSRQAHLPFEVMIAMERLWARNQIRTTVDQRPYALPNPKMGSRGMRGVTRGFFVKPFIF
ncbi:hypothetical protein KM043_016827 [Ampulex compressa]|nr:hypothetical protein KM043_016827 [Ampulex compressa]